MQSRNRPADTENSLVVTREGRGGGTNYGNRPADPENGLVVTRGGKGGGTNYGLGINRYKLLCIK